MIRQSHFLRHCWDWFQAAWNWLLTDKSAAKCVRDGAEFFGSRGALNLVKQLRLFLLLLILTASFSIALVAASSSTSTISTAPQMNSNLSSLAPRRLFKTSNQRAGRFSTQEEMKPANSRRLSGQYLCTWKTEICEQEPISFLLGPDCCNSMCTDVKTDMFNCGTCGHICFYGSICCNGDCTEIFSDNRNCGACNNICPLGEECHYGMCGYT